MKHLKITISGKVQGVWYRKSAQLKAIELGLSGTVRNLASGGVYAEVEGNAEALDVFVSWCWEGPPLAVVHSVEVESGEWRGFHSMEVIR
jgi:acylphosphatase